MENRVSRYIAIWGVIASVLLGGVFRLQGEVVQEILIYFREVMKMILGIAGLIMIIPHIKGKENNYSIFIAMSYTVLVLILMIRLFCFSEQANYERCMGAQYRLTWFISVLQYSMILCMIKYIDAKTNMTYWCRGIVGSVVFCVLIIFICSKGEVVWRIERIKYENLWMHSLLCIAFVCVALKNMRYLIQIDPTSRCYFVCLLSLAIVDEVIAIVWYLYQYKLAMWLPLITSIIWYYCLFSFAYYEVKKCTWKTKGDGLLHKQEQLKQDRFEKHLLAFASYTLNDCVNHIDTATSQLRERVEVLGDRSSLKYIEKIRNNSYRLSKLSTNILDLGQMDIGEISPTFQVINLSETIRVLIESIIPFTDSKAIGINLIATSEPVLCYADADGIERVMLNLISNAIKYSKEGGCITVYVNKKKERAFLCVKDTGTGIPDYKLKGIFNRFERVENSLSRKQEGSGLGLAIVKSIVDLHGGKIHVSSEVGKGTQIAISLPLCEEQKILNPENKATEALKRRIKVEFSDIN